MQGKGKKDVESKHLFYCKDIHDSGCVLSTFYFSIDNKYIQIYLSVAESSPKKFLVFFRYIVVDCLSNGKQEKKCTVLLVPVGGLRTKFTFILNVLSY